MLFAAPLRFCLGTSTVRQQVRTRRKAGQGLMSSASVISVRKAVAQAAARRMALVRGRSMGENAAGGVAWAYLGLVTFVFVLFRMAGDRWWFATVLIYSPRWLYAAPLAVLAPGRHCGTVANLCHLRLPRC